ncbi:MAG: hypothetical protein ACK5PF_00930, partial [bacterium]
SSAANGDMMTIREIIDMCEARLVQLDGRRTSATSLGDIRQVQQIDAEKEETQTTLNQLRTLLA